MKYFRILTLTVMASAILSSCSDDTETESPNPANVVATTVRDLDADTSRRDPLTGAVVGSTGHYTLFSLATNKRVATSDSATKNWDIGFRGTNIIVNGGSSGSGVGGAAIISGIFEEIKSLTITGGSITGAQTGSIFVPFQQDSASGVTPLAIPNTSGNGWYNYDRAANLLTAIPGRILAIKTADGKFAKIEIISYYKGNPSAPTANDKTRYYTFRYVYQPNGTGNFN